MRVPESLKLNRFKLVHIPSNVEYFRRFGNIPCTAFSGEDHPAQAPSSKLDSLADFADYMDDAASAAAQQEPSDLTDAPES